MSDKGTSTRPTVKKLHLHNHQAARRTLARLLRVFHSNPRANIPRFRAEVYGLNCLLSYFQLEADLEIEKRLEDLEELLQSEENVLPFRRVK